MTVANQQTCLSEQVLTKPLQRSMATVARMARMATRWQQQRIVIR